MLISKRNQMLEANRRIENKKNQQQNNSLQIKFLTQ